MGQNRSVFNIIKKMKIDISRLETISQKTHLLIIVLLSISLLLISSKFLWTGHLHTSALNHSMNDQTGYVTTARNIAEKGKYESNIYYPSKIPYYKDHNLLYMPGNYYILAAFFYIFGYSTFTAFLPNILSFIGSVILLFLIAKKFFDIKTAYLTVFLFMLFPPFLLYAFSAMQEILFVFACLLSFYIFISLPQKTRYICGGLTILLPFLVRETAALMVFGFAIMIFFEHKSKRLYKVIAFILISLTLLLLTYFLPQVANKVPLFWGRLTPYGMEFYDYFTLEKSLINFVDITKIIVIHFLKNIMTFKFVFTLWPWDMGFAFFMIIFFLFVISTVLLIINRPINKAFISFTVIISVLAFLSMFLLYKFTVYRGLRVLLFLMPFYLCIISYTLASGKLLKTRAVTAALIALIFFINSYSLWGSLLRFHKEFVDADAYARKCADFLDSIGVSTTSFFVGPYELSLEYVNDRYPVKYSFIPINEKTLKLLTVKFPVDTLIIPSDHHLVYDRMAKKFATSLLEDKFIMTDKRIFENKTYLIFKANMTIRE
jgi:4-amino-4-deoxy-L-arabinose transferase-like glycosyltransferase